VTGQGSTNLVYTILGFKPSLLSGFIIVGEVHITLSLNVRIPEKNRISTHETRQCGSLYRSKQLKDHENNYPTHDLEFAALLYAMDIYGRIISMASSVKFIPTIRVSGKYSRESVRT